MNSLVTMVIVQRKELASVVHVGQDHSVTNRVGTHRRMQNSMLPGCYGVLNDKI